MSKIKSFVLNVLYPKRKALAAAVGLTVTWFSVSYADQSISQAEWYNLAWVILGTLGVHQVTNKPAP